jgi:hypothetical protein
VPVSFTTCGLVLAPSVMVTAPPMLPVLFGEKVTLKVHVEFAATLAPHVPPLAMAKSPLATSPFIVSDDVVELFFNVTVCIGLVVPIVWDVNVRLAGEKVTAAIAVPVRFTTC